jgi:hypothetical protein
MDPSLGTSATSVGGAAELPLSAMTPQPNNKNVATTAALNNAFISILCYTNKQLPQFTMLRMRGIKSANGPPRENLAVLLRGAKLAK